jgi:hypothetical protein
MQDGKKWKIDIRTKGLGDALSFDRTREAHRTGQKGVMSNLPLCVSIQNNGEDVTPNFGGQEDLTWAGEKGFAHLDDPFNTGHRNILDLSLPRYQ